MSDTGLYFAVEGYVELAQWLVTQWGDLATKVAQQLDSGGMTADGLTADATAGAILAMQSILYTANEPLDALAVLTGDQDRVHIVISPPFSTSADLSGTTRTLAVRGGALESDFGGEQLTGVEVFPATLPSGATDFSVRANATGHTAATYSGIVDVSDASGGVVGSVAVWLAV